MQVYVNKYEAWLHVLITLCTFQGSPVHTLFLRWCALGLFQTGMENNCDYLSQFQIAASTILIQQGTVLWLIFWWAGTFSSNSHYLSFSVARTYKRLTQPYRGFGRLYQYSETFSRTFLTRGQTQSMPRSRDATSMAENWTLSERRVRHLGRTVPGRYHLCYHTMMTVWH